LKKGNNLSFKFNKERINKKTTLLTIIDFFV
jgi:hypothetical protein